MQVIQAMQVVYYESIKRELKIINSHHLMPRITRRAAFADGWQQKMQLTTTTSKERRALLQKFCGAATRIRNRVCDQRDTFPGFPTMASCSVLFVQRLASACGCPAHRHAHACLAFFTYNLNARFCIAQEQRPRRPQRSGACQLEHN